MTAGASGVGTAATQLAASAGARVIAIAGPGKADVCSAAGAQVVLDTEDADLFGTVMNATDGKGAEVVLDLVGGQATETMWSCVAREGRYLPVGFNDDPESGMTGRPLRKVSTGNISIIGVLLGYNELALELRRMGLNPLPPSVGREVHDELLKLVADGTIRPFVARRIGLDDVGASLEDHAARRSTGRTVAELAT